MTLDSTTRYAEWLLRRLRTLIVVALALFLVSAILIGARLRLISDLATLLPPNAPAVRDLQRLSQRVVARDTALVIVVAPDPQTLSVAMQKLSAGALHAGRDLVERVDDDDAETRGFLRAHKHLYIPLPDLVTARDAIAGLIATGKLANNPLFVQLDDEPAETSTDHARLDQLLAQTRDADQRLEQSSYIRRGTIGLIVIGTAFPTTDVARGKRLIGRLSALRSRLIVEHPGLIIGFTGGVTTTLAEQSALVDGMVWSSVITAALVTLLLIAYLRSWIVVWLLVANVFVAITIGFAVAVFTVGHLNVATAFLGAIIAGNGINYGILLAARYREERTRATPVAAMGRAIQRTLRPTLVAAFGAAIAYGSLAATSFRGFADFAAIGSVGMILCWLASYTLLPALILRFAPGAPDSHDPGVRVGRALAWIFARVRPTRMCAFAGIVSVISIVIVARYIAADPFEYDLHALRAASRAAAESRAWIKVSDATFGKSISGRIVFAADRREQVPLIVDALRSIDIFLPPDARVVGRVSSILDVIPADQAQRLGLLSQIRALLDDPLLQGALSAEEAEQVETLRPPDDLRPVTEADLPPSIRQSLTERDGRVGYLVAVRPGPKVDQWNGHDLVRLAAAVRSIRLADGETVTTSGASVVFADIISAIRRDGPVVTGVAVALLVVMVTVMVGRPRTVVAVLAATSAGTIAMLAFCALIGIRVNFLDFVALPITLGLGVDYAINVAQRAAESEGSEAVLRTSGSAVLVCSLTTVIGYASLLVSDHGAIRSLALPLLLGEITCVVAAFALVPAVMFLGPRRMRGTPERAGLRVAPPTPDALDRR